MAMKKTDKPTPGTGAPQRKYNTVGPARTPSKTPVGRRPTKPVVKVQPKGAVKKSAVRNPSAPKPVGSGTSVTLLNKGESAMKRAKAAGRDRSGNSASGKATTPTKNYKTSLSQSVTKAEQRVKNTPDRGSMSSFNDLKKRDEMMRSAAGGKSKKSSGVTPKKKAEAPKSAKPKRKLFMGRGGGMRGGVGGGGDMFGQIK
jgi:hypothetical protein